MNGNNTQRNARVAIYARVSTTDQTCESQLRDLREYVAARGWQAVEFVDHGISGTKERRPALDRLMADARKRRFDVVLVWRFDRFARSTKFLIQALEEFRHLGISFVSYQENLDTGSPLGTAIFTIIAAMAKLERDIIAERVKAGLRRARADGKRIGRPKLAVDQRHLEHVATQGLSIREAARVLGVSPSSCLRLLRAHQATAASATVDQRMG
jgi:DNA invertase Pin-like site-specific DNA recombinase